jgi:hypothetical protein
MTKLTREQYYAALAILQTMPPEDMEPKYLTILEEMDSAFSDRRQTMLTLEEIQEAIYAYYHHVNPPLDIFKIMMKLPTGSVRQIENKYLTFRLVKNEDSIAWDAALRKKEGTRESPLLL